MKAYHYPLLRALPKEIKGIKKIETLIIDDGSTDGTSSVAKHGVNHIFRFDANRGLGQHLTSG